MKGVQKGPQMAVLVTSAAILAVFPDLQAKMNAPIRFSMKNQQNSKFSALGKKLNWFCYTVLFAFMKKWEMKDCRKKKHKLPILYAGLCNVSSSDQNFLVVRLTDSHQLGQDPLNDNLWWESELKKKTDYYLVQWHWFSWYTILIRIP